MTDEARIDLSLYPADGNIALISAPRQFEGGEEAYDTHIGAADFRPGQGAWRLIQRHAGRKIYSWLELGAGSGTCTLGLIEACPQAACLITDTSPAFLRMIQRKLAGLDLAPPRAAYATLAFEDLEALPGASVDAIVIASALHHVWDWRGTVRQTARILREGGVLVLQEPCREGNLLMASVLDAVLSPQYPPAARPPAADLERIRAVRDSIYYLADTSIPKEGEDKHSFLPNELIEAATDAGFRGATFYSNLHFQDLLEAEAGQRRGRMSFIAYLDSFLEHHHRLSPAGLRALRRHLFPCYAGLERVFSVGDGGALLGCLALTR